MGDPISYRYDQDTGFQLYINGEWIDVPRGHVNLTDINPVVIKKEEDIPWYEEPAIRASGEVICDICQKEYWKHPQVAKDQVPTLIRACDGRLLKL